MLDGMSAPNGKPHPSTLPKFLQIVNGFDGKSFSDDGERSEALLAAYALVSRLESPWETVLRLSMTQVSLITLSVFPPTRLAKTDLPKIFSLLSSHH